MTTGYLKSEDIDLSTPSGPGADPTLDVAAYAAAWLEAENRRTGWEAPHTPQPVARYSPHTSKNAGNDTAEDDMSEGEAVFRSVQSVAFAQAKTLDEFVQLRRNLPEISSLDLPDYLSCVKPAAIGVGLRGHYLTLAAGADYIGWHDPRAELWRLAAPGGLGLWVYREAVAAAAAAGNTWAFDALADLALRGRREPKSYVVKYIGLVAVDPYMPPGVF